MLYIIENSCSITQGLHKDWNFSARTTVLDQPGILAEPAQTLNNLPTLCCIPACYRVLG